MTAPVEGGPSALDAFNATLHEAEERLQAARAAVSSAHDAAGRLTHPGYEEVALTEVLMHVTAALSYVTGVMDEDEVPA